MVPTRYPKARSVRRPPRCGSDFVHIEVLSGVVLAAATIAALVWANVATAAYEDLWHTGLRSASATSPSTETCGTG